MEFKQRLVGTALGRFLVSAREAWTLQRALLGHPEQVGALLNDRCARILVTRLCKPSAVFVDVGAHIGSVLAEAVQHEPSIRVVAFEAIPAKAADLSRRFPSAAVHSCALGDHAGEVSFFVDLARSGYSSLARPAGAEGGLSEIKVRLCRLDDLIDVPAAVDVIKIDVEGGELMVLRGAQAVLSRCRPTVMFESAPGGADRHGSSPEELYAWFAGQAYDVVVPDRVAHDGPGLAAEAFAESHLYPRRTTNYFAIARERRIEIRDRARKVLGVG
jgi:FkbM family methyltransferase